MTIQCHPGALECAVCRIWDWLTRRIRLFASADRADSPAHGEGALVNLIGVHCLSKPKSCLNSAKSTMFIKSCNLV